MSIIDSIQLSGSSYDVRDKSATTVVSLTQQEYDALPSSAKTANILYNITDAQAGDLTQYWTSAQTQSAITEATSGLQQTLTAGTGIDITDNVISATGGGGGGKAVTGGTNISVTTGETADTINCTLPITASTSIRKNDVAIGNDIVNGSSDYRRITIGNGNKYQYNSPRTAESILIGTPSNTSNIYNVVKATNCIGIGGNSLEVGYDNSNGYGSIAIGYGSKSIINKSLAIGYNTIASGTTQTNINNQLKIDTSNQIYIKDKTNTNEICLQDYLGGGGGNPTVELTQAQYDALVTAGTVSADTYYIITDAPAITVTTAITSSSTDTQVPSAKAVYDQLGGLKLVKLTQSEYDALAPNYDSNTLYVIVN